MASRPQHLLGAIGLIAFLVGVLGTVWLTVEWILTATGLYPFPPLHQRPLLLLSVATMLLGVQMMTIGFIAELITAYNSRDEDSFSIAATVGTPQPPPSHSVEGAALPDDVPKPEG